MADAVIVFQRPLSFTPRLIHAWVHDCARERQETLGISGAEEAGDEGFLLRVRLDDDAAETSEAEFAALMTEMRLLGFRPTVLEPAFAPDRA